MTETINTDMEKIAINTDVLVIGGGYTGAKAASEISGSGYKVILIEKGTDMGGSDDPRPVPGSSLDDKILQDLLDKVNADDNIEVLVQTTLAGAQGVPGDLSIRLSKNNEIIEKTVGAVVIATDLSINVLNAEYGVPLSETVVSQSRIEEILLAKDSKKQIGGKTVAFVVGFAQEGNPLVMERVMRSALAVEKIDGCNAYVCVGDLKVSAAGLERLYKEGRDNHAIYFKLPEAPQISKDGKTISFVDPVLRKEIELSPDLLVIEEELCADQSNEGLADLLRIDLGPFGFLQKENVHLFPVCSNRKGIFVVGSSREIQNLPVAWTDVENAVLELKTFLGDGNLMVPSDRAVVDTGKCVFCLTCYRCCPHGAIYWNEGNKVVISPIACQSCGICASECPMDAIQIGGFKDDDIKGKIKECAAAVKESPLLVAFCCRNSAYEAGKMADEFDLPVPAGLRIIEVSCAGKIDLDYILTAFVEGADGVLVMACHNGNCKSEKGNIYAGWRVNDAHRMLEETGYEKERLSFVTLASNMGPNFSSAVMEMEEKIKGLGTGN